MVSTTLRIGVGVGGGTSSDDKKSDQVNLVVDASFGVLVAVVSEGEVVEDIVVGANTAGGSDA
jgi:hypothetical protein